MKRIMLLLLLAFSVGCEIEIETDFDTNREKQEEAALQEAIQRKEKAQAAYAKGQEFTELEQWGQAIECYTEVIELDPQHARAFFARGVAQGGKGNAATHLTLENKGTSSQGRGIFSSNEIWRACESHSLSPIPQQDDAEQA